MEVRELLIFYEYDGDNAPVIQGSALESSWNGDPVYVGKIKVMELMEAVDTQIPASSS
jgi:elongation factor Tu